MPGRFCDLYHSALFWAKYPTYVPLWKATTLPFLLHVNPPRCKRRVRSARCCYAFYAFCSAREAHVPHRPPAILLGGMEKPVLLLAFWRGSGENHQITSAQDRGVRWRQLALVGAS